MKLTAATTIRAGADRVRGHALDPASHARWDLRFTHIEPLDGDGVGAPQRFRYATRIGAGLAIDGWGETLRRGERGSVLRFGSEHPLSLIERGAGSWSFSETPVGLRLSTTYDYSVRFGRAGRLVDRALFRPLMQWATRWSFDRLRLWLEDGLAPELALRLWATKVLARLALAWVWIWEGLVPKVLHVRPEELELTARAGLVLFSPRATLALLGLFQVALGLWLASGLRERAAVLSTTAFMVVLSAWVAWLAPALLLDPLGGIPKNAALVACAVVVWVLAPGTPDAARGRPVREEPTPRRGQGAER